MPGRQRWPRPLAEKRGRSFSPPLSRQALRGLRPSGFVARGPRAAPEVSRGRRAVWRRRRRVLLFGEPPPTPPRLAPLPPRSSHAVVFPRQVLGRGRRPGPGGSGAGEGRAGPGQARPGRRGLGSGRRVLPSRCLKFVGLPSRRCWGTHRGLQPAGPGLGARGAAEGWCGRSCCEGRGGGACRVSLGNKRFSSEVCRQRGSAPFCQNTWATCVAKKKGRKKPLNQLSLPCRQVVVQITKAIAICG